MSKTTYVLQQNGQVTLPSELREEYALKTGDEIKFIRSDNGWIVTKTEPDPMELLDQLGDLLKAKGVSLEQLMEERGEIQESLVEEVYGLTSKHND